MPDNEPRCPFQTQQFGRPVDDNQHSQSAGPRGPLLMQDVHLVEKMAHFNRERIPERVVHAKGYGAFGKFTVTNDISDYCMADLFSKVGKETEVFARFSTVGGESGSADSARDPRGFALKFYTDQGVWDLVGNNTPIFFIRDPLKFSDFIRTQKREPQSHLKPHWRRWDFWGEVPEALHQVMFLYGDRGTPKSARFMNGYGSHTFSIYNRDGVRHWVKFHFKTEQGIENFSDEEAIQMAGEAPDYSTRDLFDAIQSGDYPRWKLCLQMMPEKDAETYQWHPFDLTKVWPHEDYPLMEVGVLELNRNPQNYFQDVEQAAFEPGNLVDGIGISPDRMLQNRVLSYPDAHRYRLGVNYHQVPVNSPRCPYATYHRDGAMRVDGNGGGSVDYEPNKMNGPKETGHCFEPPMPVHGDGRRYDEFACDEQDYFGQPRLFWNNVLDEAARERLCTAIANSMADSPERIRDKMLQQFAAVDDEFAKSVASKLEEPAEEPIPIA
ncbi:catalase [Rhodopirellula sp. MGV]|uniref:catalase n=1 Tax=Rhodopirellula sp. MGV TaxID=2023130 RepID=UPI000B95CF65|nr:catalase [Rhodopirellula sp. MGV]OYP33800.1 catalase [Rhodopirellula sp. MGV]PNY37554.1 catalase [Rhodopirellula baltica]